MTIHLLSFGWTTMIPEGNVELLITLGMYPTIVLVMRSFLGIKTLMAHNAIQCCPSTYHQVKGANQATRYE